MKKNNILYIAILAGVCMLAACKQLDTYEGGIISPFISNFDLREIYKGSDVALSEKNMRGASFIRGIVVSDHSGGNMPAGLLVLQNSRAVNGIDSLRGISVAIGADAASYVPGDSVHVRIAGGVLTRKDGILQITGVPAGEVSKIASGRPIPVNRVPASAILAKPDNYESTLVAIVKAGFDPIASPQDTYEGNKTINDGFEDLTLHTEPGAKFAKTDKLNFNANYFGIIFNTVDSKGNLKPQHRIRTLADVRPLSATPEITPIIISGYMADPLSSDANYEYIQFFATRDINFAVTPYSVVTTNNAGASNPTGFPTLGWATGSLAKSGASRTYKFNLTSGTISKGEYFYVGCSTKLINGSGSASIANAKWIRSLDYNSNNGDGFGLKTSNLLANSGNGSGIAVFEGTTVDVNSSPVDVIFIGNGGSLNNGTYGFKIANNDFYDKINPITLEPQPFYLSGTNTMNFIYQSSQGLWNMLGGVYNESLGKWVKARTQTSIPIASEYTLNNLEGRYLKQTLDANNNVVRTDTIYPTRLKSMIK